MPPRFSSTPNVSDLQTKPSVFFCLSLFTAPPSLVSFANVSLAPQPLPLPSSFRSLMGMLKWNLAVTCLWCALTASPLQRCLILLLGSFSEQGMRLNPGTSECLVSNTAASFRCSSPSLTSLFIFWTAAVVQFLVFRGLW